jgi:peptide/nickel transport system permease protein
VGLSRTILGAVMLGFVIEAAASAIVMAVISVLVFVGVYAIGNPIDVLIFPTPTRVRQQTTRSLRARSAAVDAVPALHRQRFSGDFGRSFVFNMPVLELIFFAAPGDARADGRSRAGSNAAAGIPLGMYAGYKPHGMLSRLIMGLSILGFSVPTFWVGLVLIFTFAVSLGWLPAGGRGDTVIVGGIAGASHPRRTSHLLLPALNLSLFKLAMLIGSPAPARAKSC